MEYSTKDTYILVKTNLKNLSIVNLLNSINHENLLISNEIYENSENVWSKINCVDATLQSYVKLMKFNTQNKLSFIFQLLSAIDFLHKLDISHGNIKNSVYVLDRKVKLLIDNSGKNKESDIHDFGSYCVNLIGGFEFIETILDVDLRNSIKSFLNSCLSDSTIRFKSNQLLKHKIFNEFKEIKGNIKIYKYPEIINFLRDNIKIMMIICQDYNIETKCAIIDIMNRMKPVADKLGYKDPISTPELSITAIIIGYNLINNKNANFDQIRENLKELNIKFDFDQDKYIRTYIKENNGKLYSSKFYNDHKNQGEDSIKELMISKENIFSNYIRKE